MNFITKVLAVILIQLLALNLFLPQISSAYQSFSSPLGGEGGVRGQITLVADAKTTRAQPEVLATPEEDIPVEKIEKGGVRWYWIVLGLAVIGGAAAAAGGGGGSSSPSSSGGSSDGGGGGGTGTITGAW